MTPVAVIETDAFCEKCGFNLRSQKIWRDERLGILVCRCPECGEHAAAGKTTAAATPWLRRLALLGLMFWLVAMIAFVLVLLLGLLGTLAAAEEGLSNQWTMSTEGVPLTYGTAPDGTFGLVYAEDRTHFVPPGSTVLLRWQLIPSLGGPAASPAMGAYGYSDASLVAVAVIAGLIATATYAAGALIAAACWFWNPRKRWLWLLLPVVAYALAYVFSNIEQPGRWMGQNGYVSVIDNRLRLGLWLAATLGQLIVLATGLATGRGLARGVLTAFLPPGPRQLFAFLWHCDGKTMPAAKPQSPL